MSAPTTANRPAPAGPSRTVAPGLLLLPSLPGGLVLPLLPGALCKGQDPRLWFPSQGGSHERAKAVCQVCPARADCLDWAMQTNERNGVWGGTSPNERALLRRRDRRGLRSRAAG